MASVGTTQIRPLDVADESVVACLLQEHWGDRNVISRGKLLDAARLPGFIAAEARNVVGLITLHIEGSECEIVTLDAFTPGRGVGRALLTVAEEFALQRKLTRLWLITSNDNIGALGFYQKVGFRLVAVHRDGITEARKRKPQIPLVARNGIPIRDEIELEKMLCIPQ
jgi:ribosomal protein S18 acetylase RimI-like enzyme